MEPVIFDYDKCNNDGICADVCQRKLIKLDAKTSRPESIPEAVELCINCGHCLAVCPTSAITVKGVSPENCRRISRKELPDYQQVDLLMRSRRSIRVYKDRPLDQKIIEQLLDTCRYAPSGSNTQPVHWIVASGRDRLDKLAQMVIDWMQQEVDERSPVAERMHLDVVVKGWKRRGSICWPPPTNSPIWVWWRSSVNSPTSVASCTDWWRKRIGADLPPPSSSIHRISISGSRNVCENSAFRSFSMCRPNSGRGAAEG